MTATAIRKQLSDYIQKADEKKIRAIFTLLENEIKETQHISIEQYNRELEEAEAEYQNGEYISHEEMTNKVKEW